MDAANEYEGIVKVGDLDSVDADAPEPPRRKEVIGVLMFACNRVTVSKALDLLLKYRPSKEQFPVIVSQVTLA